MAKARKHRLYERHKVLIVDDNDLHRRLLLSYVGAALPKSLISVAMNLEDAKKALARDSALSLLVLDFFVGETPATDFLKLYPRNERKFAILVVTGDQTEGTLELAFQNGADDYITKPINQKLFTDKIQALALGEYLSPLLFFGKSEGLGDTKLTHQVNITRANEEIIVFDSEFQLPNGALIVIEFSGLAIPVEIASSILNDDQDVCVTHANVLPNRMTEEQRRKFRKTLFDLS